MSRGRSNRARQEDLKYQRANSHPTKFIGEKDSIAERLPEGARPYAGPWQMLLAPAPGDRVLDMYSWEKKKLDPY